MKTMRFAVKYELDSKDVLFYVDILENMIEEYKKYNEECFLKCDFDSIIKNKTFSYQCFLFFMEFCEDKELVKKYGEF